MAYSIRKRMNEREGERERDIQRVKVTAGRERAMIGRWKEANKYHSKSQYTRPCARKGTTASTYLKKVLHREKNTKQLIIHLCVQI